MLVWKSCVCCFYNVFDDFFCFQCIVYCIVFSYCYIIECFGVCIYIVIDICIFSGQFFVWCQGKGWRIVVVGNGGGCQVFQEYVVYEYLVVLCYKYWCFIFVCWVNKCDMIGGNQKLVQFVFFCVFYVEVNICDIMFVVFGLFNFDSLYGILFIIGIFLFF